MLIHITAHRGICSPFGDYSTSVFRERVSATLNNLSADNESKVFLIDRNQNK